MRIHCTVRRSATRIHCTVRAINSQCVVRAVNIHVWSDSIASPFCNLFAWKIFPEWKHFVVSINVPPPQLWGGQHTEMFVNHVTVFSQSVSHIRLSHTISIFIAVKVRNGNFHNFISSPCSLNSCCFIFSLDSLYRYRSTKYIAEAPWTNRWGPGGFLFPPNSFSRILSGREGRLPLTPFILYW